MYGKLFRFAILAVFVLSALDNSIAWTLHNHTDDNNRAVSGIRLIELAPDFDPYLLAQNLPIGNINVVVNGLLSQPITPNQAAADIDQDGVAVTLPHGDGVGRGSKNDGDQQSGSAQFQNDPDRAGRSLSIDPPSSRR